MLDNLSSIGLNGISSRVTNGGREAESEADGVHLGFESEVLDVNSAAVEGIVGNKQGQLILAQSLEVLLRNDNETIPELMRVGVICRVHCKESEDSKSELVTKVDVNTYPNKLIN